MQLLILVYIGFSAPSVVSDHYLRHSIATAQAQQGQGVSVGVGVDIAEQPHKHAKPQSVAIDMSKNIKSVAIADGAIAIGAGPFDIPGAYFANFQLQRDRPDFRTIALPPPAKWAARQDLIQETLGVGKNLKSCYYYQQARMLVRPECQEAASASLVAYNSLKDVERTWCGQIIPPLGIQTMSGACTEPVKIFPHDAPPVSGANMPPIQFMQLKSKAKLQALETCTVKCEVTTEPSCQKDKAIDCLPPISEWTIGGTTWDFKLYNQIPGIKVDRRAYRNFSFSASQSFQSDIPLPSFDWDRDGGTPPLPVNFLTADKSISFLDTATCNGKKGASPWAVAMKEKAKLASYGDCIHTTPVPDGLSLQKKEDRQTLLQKHLFTLIVESTENDFVGDAIWEALHAGVIPVYYGANNIAAHVPPNSIISASVIGTKDGTAELVMEIANNKTLWETFHDWRKEPFSERLKEKFEFVKTEPFCRVCKWAYAKRYGLGWNHKTQEIQEPLIPRDTCASKDGFLIRPFRETWFSSSNPNVFKTAAATSCEDASLQQSIHADDFTVTRTVIPHDSIVDIIIPEVTSKNGEVVLRLEVPIKNWEGAFFRDVHQLTESQHVPIHSSISIQDRTSRMTVLTNWPAQFRCPTHGIVEIVVQDANEEKLITNEIRRIRILLEDTSSLRDVMTEYGTSPFAKPLIQDFMDPLELFYTES